MAAACEGKNIGRAGSPRGDGARRRRGVRVAALPGAGATIHRSEPATASELVPALDESIGKAKTILRAMDDTALLETWRIMNGDREIVAIPRIGFVRSIMLNHWYHHRGQLSVYLRELDVAIPSIYGPTCGRESVRLESRCARRGRDAAAHVHPEAATGVWSAAPRPCPDPVRPTAIYPHSRPDLVPPLELAIPRSW